MTGKEEKEIECPECSSTLVSVHDEDEGSYVCEDCETVFVPDDEEDGEEE